MNDSGLGSPIDFDAGPSLPVLPSAVWGGLVLEHRERAEGFTREHLQRRSRGERHPVWDFMFEYYPVAPAHLARWFPGAGVALEMGSQDHRVELPQHKDFFRELSSGAWGLDVQRVWEVRGKTITYVHRLLKLTAARPAELGCFGLHEWAMVYRGVPRHPEPLRLGAAGTDAVVEAGNLKCTHIDAFRFFTDAAVPRNAVVPTRENQPDLEQPGCLHATMDLYKWATKLGPLVPGELWHRTFALACDVRRLDMEASPYDLREWGFEPVRIEDPTGRAEYVRRQKALSERGQVLRAELVALLEGVFPALR